MTLPPPLSGLRVIELAGLAPGKHLIVCSLLLADYGATVLRIDRPHPAAHSNTPDASAAPTSDVLTRNKSSIAVDLRSPSGLALIKTLIPNVDILIEPFRPGVLEKLGLDPALLLRLNPRLIIGRMTGFRRTGKYARMAGHDINYLAVSGVLSMLGRAHEKPYAPGNVLGDFAGGGHMLFTGILAALYNRDKTGWGQVVEANMVDGVAYLATMPRLGTKTRMWDRPRGKNVLDGGCPYYDTYETKDGGYMSVGALEPHFFDALLKGLQLPSSALPGLREDPSTWPQLAELLANTFKTKTRAEWEGVFDGTDACCVPVLTQAELETDLGFDQRPPVHLSSSPARAIAQDDADTRDPRSGQGIGVGGDGWSEKGLAPGRDGEELLQRWTGWSRGRHYEVCEGALVRVEGSGAGRAGIGQNTRSKL